MANRDFKDVQAYDRQTKLLMAVAAFQGAANPTMSRGELTVTRTGVGSFTATLADGFNDFWPFLQISANPAADWTALLLSKNVASKTFTFQTRSAGVVADPPAGSGSLLNMLVLCKNSSVA